MWLRLHAPSARGASSIPDQGTKIPHAAPYSQKIFFKRGMFLSMFKVQENIPKASHSKVYLFLLIYSF